MLSLKQVSVVGFTSSKQIERLVRQEVRVASEQSGSQQQLRSQTEAVRSQAHV